MKRLILRWGELLTPLTSSKTARLAQSNVVRSAYRLAKPDWKIPQIAFYGLGDGTVNFVDRVSGAKAFQ